MTDQHGHVGAYCCTRCDATMDSPALRSIHMRAMHGPRLLGLAMASDADIDAARVLLGGRPASDDDLKMYHATGGRLAGASQCTHTFPEYGTRGVYRHHVYSPDTKAPLDTLGETPCRCGFAEQSIDGAELHQPCWLSKGGN